jgi:hypothetical protein
MKSLHYFIIKPLEGKKYIEKSNKGIVINTSIEDGFTTQRLAEVVSTPDSLDLGVEVGDIIAVHHNTFRVELDRKGVRKESKYHINDELYYLEPELVYLVIKKNEVFALGNYCFVKQIYNTDKFTKEVVPTEQYGEVVYPNKNMIKKGIVSGDIIGFKKDSEYKFDILDQNLYMMKDHRILIKI